MDMQTFTNMNGRIGRKTYWLATIVLIVVSIVIYFILASIMGPRMSAMMDPANLNNPDFMSDYLSSAAWQQLIMVVILGFPVLALMAKRLNDRDRPSWMKWLFFLPTVLSALIGVAGLGYTIVDTGGVAMPVPSTLMYLVSIAMMVIGLWALVELGFLRGTVGPNQHGPDPVVG